MHADNGRHHSVAIGEMPASPSACVHLMLEYPTLDDVKACFARMEQEGVPESASLGRHSNDKMTSFYMRTPSGFDMEIGSDGLVIDPSNWKVTSCDSPSEWGHEWAWQKALAAQQAQ
jgi:3,4-dihydroxy-9,10-secoandrosta-1,3,5(10)-triene-9,17-dione 4,5-dioxygenase